MSDLIVLLEELHVKGDDAARDRFEALVHGFHYQLPEPLWVDLPKTKEDMAGIFTASTETVYLSIFNNVPGYVPMTAVFEYQAPVSEVMARWSPWKLTKYVVQVYITQYSASTLADAVVLSRKIASLRSAAAVSEQAEASPARLQ